MQNRLRKFPPTRKLGLILFFAAAMAAGYCHASESDEEALLDMRAQRRAAMFEINHSPEKSDEPALFGLLVIPVDFADARLPESWDANALTRRLTADSGESLRQYFDAASRGRLDLRVTQTSVIHLPGTRRDYSDVGYNGFTRTRALATESLNAVKDLGLEFRRLDMEGPDRIPGTSDDDGVIDGVLILHSGIGQENDPVEGLVQALQFFLDDPVTSQGIDATFYAVASLQSGPGIWAHETGHLLGLEDRYDTYLRSSGESEVMSRGGLGRFSLMASGAWGTGDGYGASLPDAYSSLLLGWYDEKDLTLNMGAVDTLRSSVESGIVGRLWTQGSREPEFFLMETRDPEASYPFDADIPGRDLIIYHIDEDLAEGRRADDGADYWHLRASLVEADDDFRLRQGLDPGRAEDLFPGPLGKDEFTSASIPSSDGYTRFSGVSLLGIATVPSGVSFRADGWWEPVLEFEMGFLEGDQITLMVAARSGGQPLGRLSCTTTIVSSSSWGTFAGGQSSVTFNLVDDGTGVWRPEEDVLWFPYSNLAPRAGTRFGFQFEYEGGAEYDTRTWLWKDNGTVLDFESWPALWSISGDPNANGDTFWWHWSGAPFLTADESPVLACTGYEFQDSSSWPEVNYQNSSAINLTSVEIGGDLTGVRLIHAMEVEYLTADVAMDGGTVVWVDQQDREIPAQPHGGWRGTIADQAVNVLQGQGAIIERDLELEGNIPLWRTDIIPFPSDLPGPWRLRLKFGSNSLWRYKGWFVASIDPVEGDPAEAAFEGEWLNSGTSGLSWNWPWGTENAAPFIVQYRAGPEGEWETMTEEVFEPGESGHDFFLPSDVVLPYLEGPDRQRHELRVIGFIDKGKVATRSIVVFPDGGDGVTQTLSLPWPNPASDSVRFLVEIPPGSQGNLAVFDLRGRKILGRSVGAGSHLLEWDGRDSKGARAASGTYIIRLEGSGPAVMRKVVLVH